MDNYYNKFAELIRPFNDLWNSARVTCVAVGVPGERRSMTTRIVLREEALPSGLPFQKIHWLEPTDEVLICAVDFPKSTGAQILFKAIEKYRVDLEVDSTLDRVLIRWPLPENSAGAPSQTRLSGFAWHDPHRLGNRWAGNQFGEDRTCLILSGTGDHIHNLMPSSLYERVSSKLRLQAPNFDGIDALYENIMPGAGHQPSDYATFQAVFPLPLDLSHSEDGGLTLCAPKVAGKRQMQVIINFKPDGLAPAVQVSNDGPGATTEGGSTRWNWTVPWPKGADFGKASLFYDGEEVGDIDLRRWSAGDLRAVIDDYFDPEHKFLRKALLAENRKMNKGQASQAFEMAVVRLMNLLGIPLVWYGKGFSDGRNDAAGLVYREEERIVILAECTVERPEAKFSALRGRAQKLGGSLGGEVEVIPVVFTQADPPASVFEAAADHGIALVGRAELNNLFDMLSATAGERNAIGSLKGLMSSSQLTVYKRRGI